jgi:AraC family transcriptional regulator
LGFEHISLKPQTYATIIHQGPYHELDVAYRWLYGCWLLDSGYEPADQPVLEEYLNSPRFVEPKDLLTKIYLPINRESL